VIGLLVTGGAAGGAATGTGAGAGATAVLAPAALGGPLATEAFLGFGLTWTVRRVICVFTFGFGFWVNAACVWVALPFSVLELMAYPPSAPSPATLASAAIFILRLLTLSSPPHEVVGKPSGQCELRRGMGGQAPGKEQGKISIRMPELV
jgi:hypothetical protein